MRRLKGIFYAILAANSLASAAMPTPLIGGGALIGAIAAGGKGPLIGFAGDVRSALARLPRREATGCTMPTAWETRKEIPVNMSSLLSSSRRWLLRVVIACLLTSISVGQSVMPNLSGAWHLDPGRTTALHQPASATLTIEQAGTQLRYAYFENGIQKYRGELITDGKERERYKTRVDRVYYRARWVKGELVIVTRGFQDAMGTQSYSYTDRWAVTSDGNTLTHTLSDRKVVVFVR